MVNPVSSNSEIYTPTAQPAPAHPAHQASKPAPAPQDSVHLSPKAQSAASGDVDHDGDSH